MSDGGSTVRTIDWRGVAPWNMLFRTTSLAIGISIVPLATLDVLLTPYWWWLGGFLLSLDSDDWRRVPETWRIIATHESSGRPVTARDSQGVLPVVAHFATPAQAAISLPTHKSGVRTFAYLVWGGLGSLAIWSFIGGAITRIAVMRLGRDEHVGLRDALRFATRRFPAFFASALYPMALLIPMALVGAVIGLLMRMDLGVVAVSIVWGLGLAVSFVTTILLLGVFFGWPLMIATVAAEGTDSLDGLSRGFAYSFQRPVHYAFYATVAGVLSIGALWIASIFAMTVSDVAWWSTSWGMGSDRAVELRSITTQRAAVDLQPKYPARTTTVLTGGDNDVDADEADRRAAAAQPASEPLTSLRAGTWIMGVWERLIGTVLDGLRFSLFWCLVAGIYLLLRRDVDETEFEELYLDAPEGRPLPDLDALAAAMPASADEANRNVEPTATAPTASPSTQAPEPPAAENPPTKSDSEPDEPIRDE